MSSAAQAVVGNTTNYRNLAAAVLDGARTEYVACRLFLMSADKTWPKFERVIYRRRLKKGRKDRDGERRDLTAIEKAEFRKDLRLFRASALDRARTIVEQNGDVLFNPSLWSAWLTFRPETIKASLLTDEQIRTHARNANIRPMGWATLAEPRL